MNGDTIRTITIRGQSEGLDKLTADVNKLAAAQQNVAVVSEQSAKRVLSLEDAWKRQTLRLDEAARAQANIARETKIADAALREGLATQAQHAQRLDQINQRYTAAAPAAKVFTQQIGLARYEMINMSRQIQDVGVSLASGQSPFTVMVQQGAQIADIFASSSGTVMGFFRQAGAAAVGFAASTAGIVTGIVAVGAAVVYSAASYSSAQREIAKALSGMGAASGVTKDQINAIGDASSSAFGISKSEAREAATAFASTGDIYAGNVAQATKLVNDFARAGVDSATASKNLAAAMADPAAGALEMNKSLGFLNATTLNYIRSLQAQGREQEAQAALMTAMTPKVQEQSKFTGYLAMAWNAVANAVSNTNTAVGKSTQLSPGSMRGTAGTLGEATPAGPSQDAMRAQEEQINRMKAAFQGLSSDGTAALNKLSLQADAAGRAFLPLETEIEKSRQLLAKLQQYKAVTGGTENDAAIRVGQIRTQQLIEQNDALQRQSKYIQDIAAFYPGMTLDTVKQLEAMNGQLQVAQARTGKEQIIAQEIADQNMYLMQGKGLEEALALAAEKRRITEDNVSKSIADQIQGLEDQIALSKARLRGDEARVKAQQAYDKAIRDGASEADAVGLRDATRRSEQQRGIEQATRSQDQYTEAVHESSDGLQDMDWQVGKITMQTYQMVDALKEYNLWFNSHPMAWQIENRLPALNTQFQGEEYTSTYDPLWTYQQKLGLEASVGADNVEPRMMGDNIIGYQVKQSYYDAQNAAGVNALNVSSPGAIQSSLQQVLSMGNTDAANRLIDLADPSQQTSLIQQTIDYIRQSEPPGLATEEKINALNQKLEQLANSTDSLNATMQSALSPFYSQDPRTTKLGFRAGVTGNPDWMTGAGNANPLVAVLGAGATAPGMADGGSFTVGGGYSANDNRMAVFPVASGEEVVVNRNKNGGRGGGQVVHIDNRIIIAGSVNADALSKMKVSRYQQAQRMRGQMAQA